MISSMLRPSQESVMEGAYDMEASKGQFNVFEDYFGLINIIYPSRSSSSLEGRLDHFSSAAFYNQVSSERHRINSLDSDGFSDSSSSSGSSRDFDVIYDSLSLNSEFLNYSSVPSPASSTGVTDSFNTTYNSALETLLACQSKQRINSTNKDNRSKGNSKATVCVFCRNNGESKEFYSTHTLKDTAGKTTCPILRAYTCPLCKANGDNSHTVKYCPKYTPKMKAEKILNFGGLKLIAENL